MRLTLRERVQTFDALQGEADFPEQFYHPRTLKHTCPNCGGLGVMIPYDEVLQCDRCRHTETVKARVRELAHAALEKKGEQ